MLAYVQVGGACALVLDVANGKTMCPLYPVTGYDAASKIGNYLLTT